jgi:ABC-type dipeptide/oligopeptide/nickel transport system ATPase component
VLSVEVSVDYPQKKGVLRDLRIDVLPGEVVGLVGQSGSGKSTLALALLQLLGHTGAKVSGRIVLLGKDLASYSERQMRDVRGRLMSLIPQSPAAALNPALRIGAQMREAWRAHSRESWSSQTERVMALLASASLPSEEAFLRRFPGEISVGQAQRVLIVMSLLHSPALLIADEPTSALDLITQRDVLDLIARIKAERHMSVLLISHDLVSAARLCHRMAILHEGMIVECGPPKQLLTSPAHPYTQKLVQALPKWQ